MILLLRWQVEQMDDVLPGRHEELKRQIYGCVGAWDPVAVVRTGVRPDGKMDVTVISDRFANIDSRDREGLFWPALAPIPKSEMVHLTYSLLLTPDEAARSFGSSPQWQAEPGSDWDE